VRAGVRYPACAKLSGMTFSFFIAHQIRRPASADAGASANAIRNEHEKTSHAIEMQSRKKAQGLGRV
jgi:hypothetical protein